MDAERLLHEYVHLGTSYYVSARFAHYANQLPVAGNLFHHAIEMLLKGCLVRAGVGEDERRNLQHDLKKLWAAFRTHFTDPELDAFGATILGIHAFEELRYPENAARAMQKSGKHGGMGIAVGPGPHAPPVRADGKAVSLYAVDTDIVDRLVIALFKAAPCNPLAFVPSGGIGREFLARHNACAASWGLKPNDGSR